jgi:protocatechuate 3,4-dioxygenase beta subunit
VAPATHDGWSEGVLRGLKPGPWELTVSADGVVEVVRKLTLVDGQTTLVQVTLEPGASVEGQVLDAAGAPLPGAVVFATANTSATTDAAGRFFLEGLNPGKVAISASSETAEFDPVEVEVPARGVVLQAPKRLLASGRVVDPAGRPVSPFEANGQTVTDPGGAFTVPLHKGRRLMISARKYELLSLQDAGEALGTLVLQPSPLAEGDVVDADGQPVAGARVRARSTLSDAVTGADGRFVLQLSEVSPSSEVSVIATRGALLGRAPLVLGGGRTRVVLGRGTLVSGRVLSGSTPAPGVDVAIESADGVDGSRSVTSGAGGTFEVMLWAGSWTFTAAGLRVSRTVEVAGDRTAVELGGQLGRCALEITASEPLDMVTLEPMGAEVEHGGRRPGTIVIEAQHSPHLLASDLPCETFIVSASHGVTEGQIQLRLEAHTTWNGQSPEP